MMEPIYFCFKETPLHTNNKFTLDFSNTELVYQINYITTMNCNLIIVNNYRNVTSDTKDLSKWSWLFPERGPAYQFKLTFVYLLYYYPGLKGKTEVLDFLYYKENKEFFSYKYKFYDVVDKQIKNCKIFSLLSQFKYSGFIFGNPKRTTLCRTVIEGERKKNKYSLEWERKYFDFDAHWHDLNVLFVFDKSKNRFISNKFYTEWLYIVDNEYLRHGKKLDVNNFCIDYFISRTKGSENGAVIASKDDYQKIPWNMQYLIAIIQTARIIYPK